MNQFYSYLRIYSMYVVVIVGSLLNALPLLTTRSMTYESATGNDPNNIFELDSIEIKCVLFVSLGASIPLLFDLGIDYIYTSRETSSFSNFTNRVLLVVFFLSDFIVLFILIPYEQYDILACLIFARDSLITSLFLLYLNKLSPSIFRWQAIYFIGLSFILSHLILTNSFFTTDEWFIQNYMNLLYCITGMGLIVLGSLFIIWFKYLYSIRNNNNNSNNNNNNNSSLSKSDYICNIYVISYIIFVTIEWIPILTIPVNSKYILWSLPLGVYYFTVYTLIVVSIIICISILTSRISKLEVADLSQLLQSRKEFMRYISHEIRTPLNIMKAGLTVLEEDLSRDASREQIKETILDIASSCDIAVDTLSDMLTYDKVESKNMTLERSSISLKNFFEETLRPFYLQAKFKNISLRLSVQCDTDIYHRLHMIGDESKLAQVMRNLLSNALKFTPIGGIVVVNIYFEIISSTHRLRNPPRYLKVEVIDSGAGISEENQGKLFKGIVQFNAGRLQGGGGTGLGLYISKGIVDLHGGSLSVFSAGEGSGTTFNLLLPLPVDSLFILKQSNQSNNKNSNPINTATSAAAAATVESSSYSAVVGTIASPYSRRLTAIFKTYSRRLTAIGKISPRNELSRSSINTSIRINAISAANRSNSKSSSSSLSEKEESIKKERKRHSNNSNNSNNILSIGHNWIIGDNENRGDGDGVGIGTRNGSHCGGGCNNITTTNSIFATATASDIDMVVVQNKRYSYTSNISTSSSTSTSNKLFSTSVEEFKMNDNDSNRIHDNRLPSLVDNNIEDKLPISKNKRVSCSIHGKKEEENEETNEKDQLVEGNDNIINDNELCLKSHSTEVIPDDCEYNYDYNYESDNEISINSTANMSNFTIVGDNSFLPTLSAFAEEENSHKLEWKSSEKDNDKKFKCHLLLVDDSDMNRKMMGRLMVSRCKSSSSSSSHQASDGLEAVNKVRDSINNGMVYDVILIDYHMPNMNGPNASKIIREMGYTGLIIGLTGIGSDNDKNVFLAHGADYVLLKPLNIQEFDAIISSTYKNYS